MMVGSRKTQRRHNQDVRSSTHRIRSWIRRRQGEYAQVPWHGEQYLLLWSGEVLNIGCLIQEDFGGKIIHSTEHKSARDYAGKKVVVIGACTSGE